MKTINVSMPEALREYVDSQVGDRTTYSTPSEYIRDLIRRDRRRKTISRVNDLIMEGIESGPARPLPPDWKERMRKAGKRFARQHLKNANAKTKNGRSTSKS